MSVRDEAVTFLSYELAAAAPTGDLHLRTDVIAATVDALIRNRNLLGGLLIHASLTQPSHMDG